MQTQQKLVVTYRKDQSYHELVLTQQNYNLANNQPVLKLQNALLGKRGLRNRNGKSLKDILLKNKVRQLTQNFIKKLRRNSTMRAPLQNLQDQKIQQSSSNNFQFKLDQKIKIISSFQGLVLSNWALVIWSIINILQTIIMVFIFSIIMTFSQMQSYYIFVLIRTISCVLYSLDIVFNFISQRYENGKKLEKIGQISRYYFNNGFMIDFITAIFFPMSLFFINPPITIITTSLSLLKLLSSVKKLQKFQYLVITSNQKQHYFGLIKVFATNFLIGHFLSVILNLMPTLNNQQNWHIKLGILNQAWYIKYIWGYYWGTNIMLTVGFGDITATNYTEAIILVFIQTFSCITLAYNISNVGALIGSIRENQESKKRKLKTFHRMCKENQVCSQIESKISNFIEESYQIKETFQHDARDEVIQFLPKQMQRQYRKQANKILFDGLGFLNNLSKRSLLTLAEEVNRKICHPEEIIFRKGNISDFCILQKGNLAMVCKTRSNLDGKIIENLTVDGISKPKILSLDFIKNKLLDFNIKSLNYSVLYYLNRQCFMDAIRCSQMDYQLFCVLKDKDQSIIDENNLYPCHHCKNQFHNKFQCTRLHYIPLKQNIVMKYLNNSGELTQSRKLFSRLKIQADCLINKKQICQQQQRFLIDNFDSQHCKQIQQLINFYQKRINSDNMENQNSVKDEPQVIGHRRITGPYNFKNLIEQKAIYKLEELIIEANKKENNFWELEIDLAYDFRYYFKQGNPENLCKMKKRRYKHISSWKKSTNFRLF